MTYGPKESDSLIVPGKLANKAGRPVAESMEGSGGIEGNAELQSTVRTQSREAVKQAQSRIRRAVDRNKQEKLTALLHHVTVDYAAVVVLSSEEESRCRCRRCDVGGVRGGSGE